MTTTEQRNLYENTLKQMRERECEKTFGECIKTEAPLSAYCCPCLAKVTLESQNA